MGFGIGLLLSASLATGAKAAAERMPIGLWLKSRLDGRGAKP